jgi:hypothetical protein
MATRSIPTVPCLPVAKASLSLVPTPSVPDTSTGSRSPGGIMTSDEKPPTPASTWAVGRDFVIFDMRRTSSSAAPMSTPASL